MKLDTAFLRKEFSIMAVKIQNELRGHSCIGIEDIDQPAKSMTSSRSFGRPVTELDDLRAAITMHVCKISEKLRSQKLATRHLQIYAHSNRFNAEGEPWNFGCSVSLPWPTHSTTPLLEIALQGIESLYTPGVIYKKTGVLAPELVTEGLYTPDLFTPEEDPKHEKISRLLDRVNGRFGKAQLFHGSLGTSQDWLPKNHLRSPRYTTCMDELLKVF